MLFNQVFTVDAELPGAFNVAIDNPLLNVTLNFDDALVFPGLVNWHDHLDFNLYPQLGDKTYDNYTQWGDHIHARYPLQIAAVLKVPADLRVRWGIYKNMLAGVSKVVNHGEPLAIANAPITVAQGHSIHSVQFEKRWKLKLNHPLKRKMPAMIHVGEGTDETSRREIDELIKWNLSGKKLIGIHGVAMTPRQASKFESLVWCPASNYFLLNKTAPISELKKHTRILFGTDSTLTSHWDIWDHIRMARKAHLLTDRELYDILTGDKASCVVVKKDAAQKPIDAFYATTPAGILLMMCNNEICLFDDIMAGQLNHLDSSRYSKIMIGGAVKYVLGDLPRLMKDIKTHYPGATFPVKTV